MTEQQLEVYVQCDTTRCSAEERQYGHDLPAGWVRRGKRHYCPHHARGK
jgi:hypothetical protein